MVFDLIWVSTVVSSLNLVSFQFFFFFLHLVDLSHPRQAAVQRTFTVIKTWLHSHQSSGSLSIAETAFESPND